MTLDGRKRNGRAFSSFIGMGVIVAVCALVAGPIYGMAAWYSPHVALNIAITIGTACLLGWVAAKTAIACVMPSRPLLAAAGLVAGAIVLYASWATNAALRIPGLGFYAADPRVLAAWTRELYEHGGVTIEGERENTTFKGPGLVALWIIEAGALTAGAAIASVMIFRARAPAFCPACRRWKTKRHGILRCGVPADLQAFADQLGAGQVDCLDHLPAGSIDDDPHLRVDVAWCPSCHGGCSFFASIISYSSNPSELQICDGISLSAAAAEKILSAAMAAQQATDAGSSGLDDSAGTQGS